MLNSRNLLLSLSIALSLSVAPYKITVAEEGNTVAKQAYMIDFETGQTLFQKNETERMPTSSMSKTLTALVVFDAVKKGQYSMDDKFLVSEKAWKKGGSKMFIEVGKEIRIEDLLKGLIVQSGNDAAICLAEGLAGSEERFADILNKKASEIGMKDSNFTNASGWPDPDHYSTAKDLALLGQALIKDHPDHYKIYAEKEFTYNDIKQGNRNPLLYRNIGADGIKTGHTEDGGYGLMASAERDNRRVILVLNGMASMQERADESARLIDWGLRSFENVKLFKAGETIQQAEVIYGTKVSVPLVAEQNIIFTLPKLDKDKTKALLTYQSPLKAPITKGDQIAELTVLTPSNKEYKFPLYAGASIEEQGFLAKTISKITLLVTGS